MLNGFAMLKTLKRKGKVVAPPMDDVSLAIILESSSPVDLTSDGPLTWSPILNKTYAIEYLKWPHQNKHTFFKTYHSSAYGADSLNSFTNVSSFFKPS